MQISEMSERLNKLGNAWEHFKSVNEDRLTQIEKKGSVDPLTSKQLELVGKDLDEQKNRLNQMETVLSRPSINIKSDGNAEDYQHKQAFTGYLRKGREEGLMDLEQKALSVGSDKDGGYLVTRTISDNMAKSLLEISPMRQLASVETISSDALDVIEDPNHATAGWTSEVAKRIDSNTPQVNKKRILTHELYAQPKATQKLIDDSFVDVEKWLSEKLVDVFSKTENASFINGDGNGKPKGILLYEAGNDWGKIEQVSGAMNAESLMKLYYSLQSTYATNATFLMNRSTIHKVRSFKDNNGQYLWNPGLALGAPDTLLGIDIREAADMPTLGKDSLSVAVGDFKTAYKIVDRSGIRVLRDPFTDKPFVKFYTTKRVGGEVVNSKAIKLLRNTVVA